MHKISNCCISFIFIIYSFFLITINVNALSHEGWVYDIINDEIIITNYHYTLEIIPDEIDGYPVTEIGSDVFFPYSDDLYDNIKIPNSVRTIGNDAFCGHLGHGFHNITVPKSVTKIGSKAMGYSKTYMPIYEWGELTGTYFEYKKLDDMIIHGYKGTAAETYAKDNGFTFIALDDEPITTTPVTTDITTTETTVVTTQTTTVSNTETTPITTTPDITENIKGDANGDGKLAASDAAFIARKLAEASVSGSRITVEDYPNADFNDDGKITAADAADIAKYLAEYVFT